SAVSHLLSGRTKTVDRDTSRLISQLLGTPADFWSELKENERLRPSRPASAYLEELDGKPLRQIPPGILVDHQVMDLQRRWIGATGEEQLSDQAFIIEPFSTCQLGPASYDTRIGGYWEGHPEQTNPMMLNGHLEIRRGETVYAYTQEHFGMPVDTVGRVGPTVDLITTGIVVSHGPLIAPLFRGKLTVALHNFTQDVIRITENTRFIKVVFEKLQSVPQQKKPETGLPERSPESERNAERRQLEEEIA
ncbi:dCTP deaminase domain-containing protein, partial [Leisingera sp. ANG-M1]|uniref:dCTP deaminase domain-containing protein n=1 Tax=Leisingera sp. ANG-M1 TaxID=1577895 RepID=UPI00187C813C